MKTVNSCAQYSPDYRKSNRLVSIVGVLSLFFFLGVLAYASSKPAPEVYVDGKSYTLDDSAILLGKGILYAEDSEANWSLEDVLSGKYDSFFAAYPNEIINFEFTDSSYWIKFNLSQESNDYKHLIFEVVAPTLDKVSLYTLNNDGSFSAKETGYLYPFNSKDVYHHNWVFKVPPGNAGENNQILLRVESNTALLLPLRLWNEGGFNKERDLNLYFMGGYYGILLVMVLYNFFIFTSVGDRSYLYYIAFIIVYGFTQNVLDGLMGVWAYPGDVWFRGADVLVLPALAGILSILFSASFLNTKKNLPRLHNLMMATIAIDIMFVVISLLSGEYLVDFIVYLSLWITMLLILVGACAVMQNQIGAKYFLLAWTFLMVGIATYILTLINVFSSVVLIVYAMKIGSSIEIILLSLGLADRINYERKVSAALRAEKKEVEDQAQLMATVDTRTGLPNRAQLLQRMNIYSMAARSEDDDRSSAFSLLLIKVMRFKDINNTLGHENGDKLLIVLAKKIREALKKAQFEVLPAGKNVEGEQSDFSVVDNITFAVVLECAQEEEVHLYAEYLRDSISGTLEFKGVLIDLEVAIGVSVLERDKNPEKLIHEAQVGLSAASKLEQRIGIYTPLIDPYSEKKLSIMGYLRKAVESEKLELYFQPQVNLKEMKVSGVEVLLRWRDGNGQFVSPTDFIPLAESSGVIRPLTRWVINRALMHIHEMQEIFPEVDVSINLSASNLREDDLIPFILDRVEEYEIETSNITFEITESSMIENPDIALSKLNQLQQCGCNIAIDDYGTGYASLGYLKQLPIREVKIDRCFIQDLATDDEDRVIVKATINMCHELGLKVVAEGVEDVATMEVLKSLGCDLIQGYLFAKPLPFESLKGFADSFNAKTQR